MFAVAGVPQVPGKIFAAVSETPVVIPKVGGY
jgi:hypothetical protein